MKRLMRWVLIGAAGGAVALLFAPKPGRELRAQLKEFLQERCGCWQGMTSCLVGCCESSEQTGVTQAKIEETRRRVAEERNRRMSEIKVTARGKA